jgi:hypothetical protein
MKIPFEKKPVVVIRKEYTPAETEEVNNFVKGDFSPNARLNWLEYKKAIRFRYRLTRLGAKIKELFVVRLADDTVPYMELDNLWEAAKRRYVKYQIYTDEQTKYYESIAEQLPDKQIQGSML